MRKAYPTGSPSRLFAHSPIPRFFFLTLDSPTLDARLFAWSLFLVSDEPYLQAPEVIAVVQRGLRLFILRAVKGGVDKLN